MSSETQTFDPHGDVVLILDQYPKVEPTSSSTVAITNTIVTGSGGSSSAAEGAQDAGENENEPKHVNMLVSSKHMMLASPVFEAMLKNQYKEGRMLASKGTVDIALPDDDPDAFVVLLNIIHGRPKKVPRQIDLALMTKISILVDKYQMHEVVGVFSDMWIEVLKADVPKVTTALVPPKLLTTDVLLWLCISWVFENDAVFKEVTELLMRTGDSELDQELLNELPIPEAVISKVPPI
jgi:hypothetical protein